MFYDTVAFLRSCQSGQLITRTSSFFQSHLVCLFHNMDLLSFVMTQLNNVERKQAGFGFLRWQPVLSAQISAKIWQRLSWEGMVNLHESYITGLGFELKTLDLHRHTAVCAMEPGPLVFPVRRSEIDWASIGMSNVLTALRQRRKVHVDILKSRIG